MQTPRLTLVLTTALSIVSFPQLHAQTVSGEAVYQAHCATCHDTAAPRTPTKSALQKLAVANILRELDSGAMAPMARDLSSAERQAVATYLGVAASGAVTANSLCAERAVTIPTALRSIWNGWSPSATNTRFQ